MIKDSRLKPRDFIAKDLRTPKYRMRKEESKKAYHRRDKHPSRLIDIDYKFA